MERQAYIGGSDAAGILGFSRWKTPLAVWAEKTGQILPKELDNEAVNLGIELEDYVARRFAKIKDKKVRRVNKVIMHPDYNFIGGHIDRDIVGEDAILECKTTSAWKAKEWQGEEIPQEYIIQCVHYLAITGAKKAYLAVLIGNQDFLVKEIDRDENLIKELIKKEVEFWNSFVAPKIIPGITGSDADTLYQLFPESKGAIDLPDEANRIVESLQGLKKDKMTLEEEIAKQENELKLLLKENETGQTAIWKINWKEQVASRIDTKKLKAEMPEVAKEYCKETKSRVLRYYPINKDGE